MGYSKSLVIRELLFETMTFFFIPFRLEKLYNLTICVNCQQFTSSGQDSMSEEP